MILQEDRIRSNDESKAMKAIIAPSLLSSDFSRLGDQAELMMKSGADWLHLDVMDGHFVPNLTIGSPVIKSLRQRIPKGCAFFDCHLMVTDPQKWIEPFAKAGSDQYTFHLEAVEYDCDKAIKLAEAINSTGMSAGLAIKPMTPLSAAIPALSSNSFKTLLVMTVEPGFGGQGFMPSTMVKVEKARSMYPDLNIQVDGGLTRETTPIAASHGANVIVAGTSIFSADDYKQEILFFREAIQKNLK